MSTDAELLDLANQAQGLPPEGPPPLARQVGAGTPGAVEGPVYKDPAAATLVDPVIAAQTPGLAEPPAPVAPVTAVPPPAPEPAPVASGKPSIQNAANAADIATQAAFKTADAQGEVAKAKAGEREGNAAAQDKVAALERAHADEIAQQQATQKAAFDQANAVASKAEDEYGKSANGLHDLMQNKTDAEFAKARIYIAVGAAAQALVGGSNPALDKVKMTIDNDFRVQESRLRSQEHFASMKRAGVASVSSQFAHDTALLGLKQAAAYQAAATEAKAEAIRRGAAPEEAENNVAVLALKQRALELNAANREKLQQSLASQMMAGAHLALARSAQADRKAAAEDKAPTQSEGENASRGRNMQLALNGLEAPDMKGYKPKPEAVQKWLSNQEQIEAASENNKSLPGQGVNWIRRKLDNIPKNELDGLDHQDQKYFTLVRQYIEPYARKASGSAINAGEWKGFSVQVGPEGGEAGRKLAKQAAEDMVTLGGRATKNLEKADRAKGTPSAPKGRRVTYKGQPGTLVGDEFTPDAP